MPQRMFRVDRHESNAAVSVAELVVAILESNDLSWTDERESGWNEEQDKPRRIWIECFC